MLTYSGEGPGGSGKLTKMKTTSEMKDKDTVIQVGRLRTRFTEHCHR